MVLHMNTLPCVIMMLAVCAAPTSQPSPGGTNVEAVRKVITEGRLAEGMELLVQAALVTPEDPNLGDALAHVTKPQYFRLDPNDRKRVDVAADRLLVTLMEACQSRPSPRRSENLVWIAKDIGSLGLAKERFSEGSPFVRDLLNAPCIFKDARYQLYLRLAAFQLYVRDCYDGALDMLDRAQATAVDSEDFQDALLQIAWLRATYMFDHEGASDQVAAALYRVIQLDRSNGYKSNQALDFLGQIALSKGHVDEARAYLALAGRVRMDYMLRAWSYEKGLALALIRAGYPDSAIEYLEIAYGNEKKPVGETLYGLALGYLAKGEKAKAKEFLKKYLEQDDRLEADLAKNLLSTLEQVP